MNADPTIILRGLPGTDGGPVEAASICNVTDATGALEAGKAMEAAGSNGAIAIWKGDNGRWYCYSMRYKKILESKQFKHLADVVHWLSVWLPQIGQIRPAKPESTGITDDLVKQLVDPQGWNETVRYSCIDGMLCPHCKKKFPVEVSKGLGLENVIERAVLTCSGCSELFSVKIEDTPLGKAWVTEVLP